MYNPFVESMQDLSDEDIDKKVAELSEKYYMCRSEHVRQQIITVLDMYRHERKERIVRQMNNKVNKEFDTLIKIK